MKIQNTLRKLACLCPLITVAPALSAQSSLACYAPKERNWSIGFRLGGGREYDNTYSIYEQGSKRYSWTQQVFVKNQLSRHFILEFQCLHESSVKDYRSFIDNSYRIYNFALRKSHRLHNNIILSYLFYTTDEKATFGIGAGLGVLTSLKREEENYILISTGETKEISNESITAELPNLAIALTHSYYIKKNIWASCRLDYSGNRKMEHASINIGLEYRF